MVGNVGGNSGEKLVSARTNICPHLPIPEGGVERGVGWDGQGLSQQRNGTH